MKNSLIIIALSFYFNSQSQTMSTKLAKWEAGFKHVEKNTTNGIETYSFCFQNKDYKQIVDIECITFKSLKEINNFANYLDSLIQIPLKKDETISGIKYKTYALSISTILGRNLITFYPSENNSKYTWLGTKDIKEFRKISAEK
jgi:hypothetical protein